MYEKNNKITRKINVRLSGLFSKRADLRTCISNIILLVAFLTVASGILGCCIVPCGKTRAKPGLSLDISTITKSIGDSGMIQPELLDPKEYISMMQKLNTSDVLLKTPRGWPINRVYSPKKSTGTFNYPEFSEIEVLLTNVSASGIYCNDYFEKIALSSVAHKESLYTLYWPRELPGATPVPTMGSGANDGGVPGISEQPVETCGLGVLLRLYEISYSSRYGGSVRLDFQMVEDYALEFFCLPANGGTEGYYYDLSELQMSFFVKPFEGGFRPANYSGGSTLPVWQTLYMEFEPTVDYVYSGANRLSGEDLEKAIDHLHSELFVYSSNSVVAGGYLNTVKFLGPFVLGFLHNEHREQLEGDFVVERISISDGEFSLYTREAQYFLDIQYKILEVNIDTEPFGEEVVIKMSGGHDLYFYLYQHELHDVYTASPQKTVHGTSSNWYRIASIPIIDFYKVEANGEKAVVKDCDGDPVSHNNGVPCYKLWTNEFDFYTNVLVKEEDPDGYDIFYDYEQYYEQSYGWPGGEWDTMDFKWIQRRYTVDIRDEEQDDFGCVEDPDEYDDFGCGFEGEIEKLVRMRGGLWRDLEVTVPLGGPGEDRCLGCYIKWRIRINVYRR